MKHLTLPAKILIGTSSCLLGENVRFDGGHKKDKFITGALAEYVDFYKVCPEADIGLGIPRPPIRLVGDTDSPEVVEVKNPEKNYTKKLTSYSSKKVKQLPLLTGYILKSKSPSCGMTRVKVYQANGLPSQPGVGIFAKALLKQYPALPVEEEGRLNDPHLRENFIERVFIYRRWQELLTSGLTKKKLIDFHSNIKLSLMAHNISAYKRLGKMMANLKKQPLKTFSEGYILELMQAFKRIAGTKGNTNALQHCMGYLKRALDQHEKAELLGVIKEYHAGLVPLIVPITLLKHYFRKYPNDYIAQQTYLKPYPKEFMLRNFL